MDEEKIGTECEYSYFPVFNEDDADETDDDADGGEDGDADTDDAEALKKELAKTKAALRRANAEALKRRNESRTLTDEQKKASDRVDALEAQIRERDAVEALRAADAQGDAKQLKALVKLLDSTQPDEIDDAIAALKETFPKLFEVEKAAGGKTVLGRKANNGTGGTPPKPTDFLTETSKKMLGIK